MRVTTLFAAAPKTASTWLFYILRQHNEVLVNESKYVHFFRHHYDKGVEWYDRQFPSLKNSTRAVLDFEPSALGDPLSFERVIRHYNEIKLIISVRNPIERDWSAFEHQRRLGVSSEKISTIINDPASRISRSSRYGDYIPRVLEHFPRDAVHIILFDDVKNEPEKVIRDVESFLGLSTKTDYEGLALPANVGAAPRLESIARRARPLAQGLRRQGYGEAVQAARELPLIRRVMFKEPTRPSRPSAAEWQMLAERYALDVAFVECLLDRDLRHWLNPPE